MVARGLRKNGPIRRSVGRGLGPAVDGCLMRTFFGKGAEPGPALQDLVASLAGCLPFCPAKKEAKKPPLIPRRGARPKGPAGPFGNPGGLMGSPETVCVPHKAKALCYNTVSFLPERLIRAPVLKPRPRSQAGKPAGYRMPIWQTSSFRPVRRGRMVAARACLPRGNVFWFVYALGPCVGEAYMPPGRGALYAGFAGKPAVCPGLYGGVKTPPCKARETSYSPGNAQHPHRFAGGIYAAPTHGPNAIATKKRYCGADVHGGGKPPPYNAKQTPNHAVNGQPPRSTAPQTQFLRGFAALPPSFFIFIF